MQLPSEVIYRILSEKTLSHKNRSVIRSASKQFKQITNNVQRDKIIKPLTTKWRSRSVSKMTLDRVRKHIRVKRINGEIYFSHAEISLMEDFYNNNANTLDRNTFKDYVVPEELRYYDGDQLIGDINPAMLAFVYYDNQRTSLEYVWFSKTKVQSMKNLDDHDIRTITYKKPCKTYADLLKQMCLLYNTKQLGRGGTFRFNMANYE
jgi:hypothetical protein